MKRIIILFVSLFLTACIISSAFAQQQKIRILNKSFGVVYDQGTLTESKSNKGNSGNIINIENCSDRAYIYFENDNCLTNYKVLIGNTIIGQGELDLKNLTHQITIGRTTFKSGCSVNGDLTLYID
jgi:hypothetical protein